MNEYATEIRIKFYDDNETLDIKHLFNSLQCLKAKDYLKLYQLMYQDILEHQRLNYNVLADDINVERRDE